MSRFVHTRFDAWLLFAGLLMLATPPLHAATLTVTTTGEPTALNSDDCTGTSCFTLRGAINHAASGDTIVFAPALDGQTIALTQYTNCLTTSDTGSATCLPPAGGWSGGQVTQFGPSAFFLYGKTLTIDATANSLVKGVVIARNTTAANFRLFDVDTNSHLTLRGLTLSDGVAQGGSANDGAAMGAGGAIFSQGNVVLNQCTLAGNRAQGGRGHAGGYGGAGVGQGANGFNGGGPNGTAWQGGTGGDASNAGFGGGGGAGGSPPTGTAGRGGGGGFGGGGGRGGDGGSPMGAGTGGDGGNGGFGGGAAEGGRGFPQIPNADGITGHPGFGGGTAYGYGGGGAGMGGAVFNDAGTVSIVNSTLADNAANGGGNSYSPAGNGSGFGGAAFNYNGNMSLDFVTMAGNSVVAGTGGVGGDADGGAIYSLGDSQSACSAGGNTCTSSGATLTINNSIAAGSSDGNDVVTNAINAGGNVSSGTGNLIQSESGFGGSVVSSADPQLGSLPATLTGGLADVLLPQFVSPVIDAVPCDSTAIDQRGVSRPQGAQCDIGAVEVAVVTVTAMSGSGQQADIWTSFFNPLVVQVHDGAGQVVQNVPLHALPPATGQLGAICSDAISDNAGFAAIYCRANGSAGGPYAVKVSVVPTSSSAVFLLTNTPGDGDLIFWDGFDPPGPRTSVMPAGITASKFALAVPGDVPEGVSLPIQMVTDTQHQRLALVEVRRQGDAIFLRVTRYTDHGRSAQRGQWQIASPQPQLYVDVTAVGSDAYLQ